MTPMGLAYARAREFLNFGGRRTLGVGIPRVLLGHPSSAGAVRNTTTTTTTTTTSPRTTAT